MQGTHNDRKVAIKLVKIDENVYDEIDIMRSLDHVNIVKYVTLMNFNNQFAIVLELCLHSLSEELKIFKKGLSFFKCRRLINDFVNGYQYLRKHNIVHMDIKPANILLGWDYCYKIADFGTSEKVADGAYTTVVAGSLYYCRPDVLEVLHWNKIWPGNEKVPTF